MNYKVMWPYHMKQELARLFLLADKNGHGNAFTSAANRIDELLCSNPTEIGEERTFPFRIFILPPISVHYEVDEEE